jgi:hypothetical protein
MERKLKDKLKALRNNTWIYHGNQIHVEDVIMVDAEVKVVCEDGKKIIFNKSETAKKMKEFTPAHQSMTDIIESHPKEVQIREGEVLSKLESKLMEAIENVEKNADYIPQANSISAISKQVIELNKTKIKMVSEVRKFRAENA